MTSDTNNIAGSVALQHCDRFVGRTTNWLYDHLRFVPRYTALVLCDVLLHRDEFPELTTWCLNWNVGRRIWRCLTRARLYPGEWQRLKTLAPRVLHSHFGSVAMQDFDLQRILEVPWLVGFYGADVYQGRYQELQERYFKLFDTATRVLALGPVMAARLRELGCPSEKILVHPLGVDVEHLPRRRRVLKSGEPLKVLFAGTFREKKGILYVIEAAALARRAGLRLEVRLVGDAGGKAGDQEAKGTVFRQIRRLGLDDIVTHHPFLCFQELLALALRSHVFVAPSVTAANGDAEGTPFVLQQMMATGMPAIATRHSDNPYLFGKNEHLLVPERDAGAIAQRLQRYVDDPDTLVADGTALRNQICCFFNVRKCAAQLSNLYDSVTSFRLAEVTENK